MLQIKSITKQYRTGELIQTALDGVDLNLRDNEFVSVLGPSGSGKTTLLNIIGGLDRYDSGDLVINSISTKDYKDRDWDTYRNHTIGFIFQSYNLIPHQSVLANVELALTIGGISRSERRQRAKEALEKVGLGDQLHKKPNQMSGGQMQRVAIARALVNNPKILLADEPTGALDTETGIQVMELLKEVAKDRLVVMVTHNPELAEQYSTRIVRLRDGKVTDDSNPFVPEAKKPKANNKEVTKHAKMSFLTSLSLSFNNLKTKKGRTFLTSFAGSIGIIGIALILSLSSGVNAYITDLQRNSMTSYPITITAESSDLSSMLGNMGNLSEENKSDKPLDGVYADYTSIKRTESMANSIITNNLAEFKKYLDNPDSEIRQYIGENGVVYTYNVKFSAYSHDANGQLISSDDAPDSSSGFSGMSGDMGAVLGSSGGDENFSELMPGTNGAAVSSVITDSYDVLYGSWAENYNEVVLVLNDSNGISAKTLFQLGLITADEYRRVEEQIKNGEDAEPYHWNYEEICAHTFTVLPAALQYTENADGTFTYIGSDVTKLEPALANGLQLKITGIIRPSEGAANASISSAVAYTTKLTDYIISATDASAIVKAQEASPNKNVLNGLAFEALDNTAKADDAKVYLSGMSISEKAAFYSQMMYQSGQSTESMDEIGMAAALDMWLASTPDEAVLIKAYDKYIAGGSYDDNMDAFGKVSYAEPASISIYTDSFEAKESVSACISAYNEGKDEDSKITYTDYVALLTGTITTMVDVISYVLIAFVAVSLIVSCIMIAIITHISVLERTKEIGILRAMGASKRNISQVFNAETLIIGLLAGLLGVVVSSLLLIPINAVIHSVLGTTALSAVLPFGTAIILVIISVLITVVAGLIPAKNAAKKDPVIALRTE